jgi:hypothetical protein
MTKVRRLQPEWRSYCIYTGAFLPEAELSDEHVIPKSLGGNRSTVIRVARSLNSRVATEIDGPIANDPMIMFGRRDANARGHSRKHPIPSWRGARSWKKGEPWGVGDTRYRLEFPKDGARVVDTKTREVLPQSAFSDAGFVVEHLQINHAARFKFTLKTLLGVGWKLFQGDLLRAIDTDQIRAALFGSVGFAENPSPGGIGYLDDFMTKDEAKRAWITAISEKLVVKGRTTILAREAEGAIDWSIACFGYTVGTVRVPLLHPLLQGELGANRALRLVIGQHAFEPEPVEFFLKPGTSAA